MPNLATPGVYIDEIDGLSLSVSFSATAVPVFAINESSEVGWWKKIGKPLLINTFIEFEKYKQDTSQNKPTPPVNINYTDNFFPQRKKLASWRWPTLTSLAKETRTNTETGWITQLEPALRAYFENGGGYCYICPYDKLAEFVPNMSDVTLVVQAGESKATGAIQQICTPGSMKFGLLDGPKPNENLNHLKELETLENTHKTMIPSDCTAVYYPWLKVNWHVTDNLGQSSPEEFLVAPSAVVAGLICTVDRERGIWKAPANVAVKGGLRPAIKIGKGTQDSYTQPNKIAINMIRDFDGRGTQIWGARTMTVSGNAWLYVPVRRLFDMAERDIKSALRSVLFEPNGPATWEVVRSAIDNYLYDLWKQGAFSGSSSQESYFVRVGAGITMNKNDIKNGILRVSVGLSAVRPAEYIVLEFTQQLASGA
ncbi:phage tail sheath family protein [Xenorhabdus sp. 42]|uniref:phage tail sheath family protein n=1 Tax=Xenorhabdus szentirmaii TaxID=290112 RepID=UPI00199A7D9C|nr:MULTISPECIES: phage tail sheath C-terminal domain-containing protein [unclassified Xenorhabdus]MBD2794011.1 phage tail sheath family protein [Xenorhabdus sp. CUL]MBD2803839.1 phage tail sheath family protein [Xenorhabdus sp. ZM]MBD2819787.1 phage tail sheath family protein [Xenorhabdus sp. 42]MBD2826601.1 phage tail sheath family protein [Xenorhabdus sp. 5]